MKRNPIFNRNVIAGLAGIVALLLINGWLTYRNIRQLHENARFVADLSVQIPDRDVTQQQLLRDRQAVTEQAYSDAVVTGFIATSLGLMVVGMFVWLLRRSLRSRQDSSTLLSEQRQLHHATLSSVGDGVIATDLQGRVTFINRVAKELTGWDGDTALGKPLEEVFRIVNEGTRQSVDNPALRALKEGKIVGLANHTILIAKDARERPIDDSAAPILDEVGKIIGSVLVFRDISERKQHEKKLREKDEFNRSLMDSSADCVKVLDLDGKLLRMNVPGLCLMEIDDFDQFCGRAWDSLWPAVLQQELQRALTTARGGAVYSFQGMCPTAKGTHRWWDVTLCPVRDNPDGQVVRLLSVSRDITDRRRAEEQLQFSESRLRLTLDSAELGAWHIDPTTNTLSTDERFQKLFSGKVGPINYDQAFAFLHPDDRERVAVAIAAAVNPENPAPYAEEYRVIHPQGLVVRWMLAKGRGNFEGQGEERRLTSFDGTIADVTERKEMENNLRQLAANLSDADHRKDEFLAMLAHELRNPLAPVRYGLQLLEMGGDDPETAYQARIVMERQVGQMVRLVDDLMDVSRITRGKVELRIERIELGAVLNSAVETSSPLIEQMEHELSVTLPSQPIFLHADFTRLAQVFMNLMNNAAKYSERGGRIWLTVERQGDDAIVSIKDTGIGISADHLPRIFDIFSQVDHSLEKSQGGLGIGLTLVKRLVEMHGGRVEAKSEGVGKGSEFVVHLPNILDVSPTPTNSVDSERALPKSSLRILIVDDNQDGADSLATMLRIMGNDTRTAYDGVQGIETAEQFRPEVLLFDIGLPRLNGYEACRHIRQQPWGKNVILVAVTGWGQEEDLRRSREAGFDHHLVKPVDPRSLMKILVSVKSPEA